MDVESKWGVCLLVVTLRKTEAIQAKQFQGISFLSGNRNQTKGEKRRRAKGEGTNYIRVIRKRGKSEKVGESGQKSTLQVQIRVRERGTLGWKGAGGEERDVPRGLFNRKDYQNMWRLNRRR